jgi:hypothetical protein
VKVAILSSLLIAGFCFYLKFFLTIAFILIVGIGDGYSSPEMKLVGGAILFSTTIVALTLGVTFVESLFF